ncbi:MAG: hypothetical protein LBQ60_11575 [Bacteroidales bacterium]|jgi:hypothetical protein|nr:hypothetical protein [Bacteroidales bacterium]
MKRRHIILIVGGILMLVVIASYTTWNVLDPKHTCAQCHEVAPSHADWMTSAHADVSCVECHGTALSNGYHSLSEKIGMLISHVKSNKHNEDILLTENQILEISDRCASCHQSEYAGWLSGGHAVNYREIFLDSTHNVMEKPYWDCLRCHGMFYEGNIHDLMTLEGNSSEWGIRDKKQEERPAIPCLACHQIHTENPVSKRYVSMVDSSRITMVSNPKTALYIRADKMHLRSDHLTKVDMVDGNRKVKVSGDPNALLCMQCHSPDYIHRTGSEDDRTPIGVHEGISCMACHEPHSNNTKKSCDKCHTNISDNCKIDVKKANTTYLSQNSQNDIHRLTCTSCHEEYRTISYRK